MLRRAFWASAIYAGLGLAGGLFYRELTRTHPGSPDSQLGLVHTHLLVLGMLIGLLVLLLERLFRLSASRFSRGSPRHCGRPTPPKSAGLPDCVGPPEAHTLRSASDLRRARQAV